jgi:peptidoglycan/LPS O-acetylase OafA/YrhL
VWYWTYLSNWIAPFSNVPPALAHLWSLAVEEQFYLIWPLVVSAMMEVRLLALCVGIVAASLAVRMGLHAVLPDGVESVAAYTFTIARWDAIAVGAMVALTMRNAKWRAAVVPLVGVSLALSCALATVIIAVERGFPAQGLVTEGIGQPLAGIVSAILVMACVVGDTSAAPGPAATVVTRVMSNRWLRAIGKYSYAIYLFQTPVRLVLLPWFDSTLDSGIMGSRIAALIVFVGAVFAVLLLLALMSWRLIEAPALRLKRRFAST